jgi:N-acetylmuramoyl-L-alanine amidase
MIIEHSLLTKNPYSRPGRLLKSVKGIVIHWVANPGTSARANRNYFERLKDQRAPNMRYASAHYIIGITGDVVQCVPDSEVCYHVGADRYTNDALCRLSHYPNDCTIGIELCHPSADGKFTTETLQSCRALISSLLTQFHLGRAEVWRHYDITKKQCPLYFVDHPDEWERFKASLGGK